MPLRHLASAIEYAVALTAQEFPKLVDKDVEAAYLTYRDYFRKIRQGKDLPPPESTRAQQDRLLENIWECLCAREEENMDLELLDGRLGPAHRPVTSLEEAYQICFNEMRAVCRSYRKTEGPRGYIREIKEKLHDRLLYDPDLKERIAEEFNGPEQDFSALVDSHGIRLTPLPYTSSPEEEKILLEVFELIADATDSLSKIKALCEQHPENLALQYHLCCIQIESEDEDEEAAGRLLLERILDQHPRDPLFLSTYLNEMISIDPSVAQQEAVRYDLPDQITGLDAAPDGSYSFLAFLRFTQARIGIYLLQGKERLASEQLENALKFNLDDLVKELLLEPYKQHLIRLLLKQDDDDEWPAPIGQYGDLQLSSLYIQQAWSEARSLFLDNLINQYATHSYPNALDQEFPWPRNPSNVDAALQLKISLADIEPAIFRTIVVPDDTLLPDLHGMIQTAFGWEDCHLHQFIIDGKSYQLPDPHGMVASIDYRSVRVKDVLKEVGQNITYIYDFGDYWTHDIFLEAFPTVDDEILYPRCISGARACPPEDVGGIPGYLNMLRMLKDPTHEDYEDFMDWLPEDYDPETFDLAWTHRQLWKGRFWHIDSTDE
ncbi:MAG: plasmid pRiA4b ORF-3 family protein [Bacteroidota bacterium]